MHLKFWQPIQCYGRKYGFSSSHVWMWELDYKESWVLKNWCFWTGVLEKTLESPLDCKEIQPVHRKGNQSWIFIGRTDAEAEAAILCPPDAKNWLTGRDPDAGENWGQEEKGTTEDEVVGWHHRLNGHESEQAPGLDDGQGSLVCCSPWDCKELKRLSNWIELMVLFFNPAIKKDNWFEDENVETLNTKSRFLFPHISWRPQFYFLSLGIWLH